MMLFKTHKLKLTVLAKDLLVGDVVLTGGEEITLTDVQVSMDRVRVSMEGVLITGYNPTEGVEILRKREVHDKWLLSRKKKWDEAELAWMREVNLLQGQLNRLLNRAPAKVVLDIKVEKVRSDTVGGTVQNAHFSFGKEA